MGILFFTLLPNRLFFGAVFSAAAKTQVYRRLAFLGPGFQPPRLRFVVKSPFWGQVFSQQGSGLSSTRLWVHFYFPAY
ncbi:MAG: hypothetical protein DRR08_32435 [Candidatus Parabeggiatoa sp. nov. 2]|nr:MAG: hypothetical protein DRR08_32435 [Gammaproteobacteria bacterium]